MVHTFTKFLFLFLFFLVGFATQAQDTYVWTGAINTDWNNPGNWRQNSVPQPDQGAYIGGSGITNWPIISNDLTLIKFSLYQGQIDTKGYTISTEEFLVEEGIVNNTIPATKIRFVCNGTNYQKSHYVSKSIFNGDIDITFKGNYGFVEGYGTSFTPKTVGNIYNGNVKFFLTGGGSFRLSDYEPSSFKGDLTIERTTKLGSTDLFVAGNSVVDGNFKYTDNVGGDITLGSTGECHISGTFDLNAKIANFIDRRFFMSKVWNGQSGGKIEIENLGFSCSSNNLKLSSFNVSKPSAAVKFVRNTIEGNVNLSSQTDYEQPSVLYGNKIIGDFYFSHAAGGTLYESTDAYLNQETLQSVALPNVPANEFIGNVTLLRTFPYAGAIVVAGGKDSPKFSKNLTLSGNTTVGSAGLIFNGESNSVIKQFDNPLNIPNLSIQKSASGKLVLSSPLKISQYLSFSSGLVQSTSVSPLIFLDGAVALQAKNTSHVTGPVHKIGNNIFTFPIGSGTILTPLSISAPVVDTDEFSAEYIALSPTSNGYNTNSKATSLTDVYNSGFWDLMRVNGASNVSVSLGYNVPSAYITDQSKLRIAHWNGSMWQDLGNGGTSGSLTIGTIATAGVVTDFSPFTIASSDASNPLPVKLVSFSAQKENETALLQWSTSEERNSYIFEIENSPNARDWQKIGEVKSAGESTKLSRYQFVDIKPTAGVNYYRLKMIDLDGTFAYSRIESITVSTVSQIILYPNPVSEKLFIKTSKNTETVKVRLTNSNGATVFAKNAFDLKDGINFSRLPDGIYLVKITLPDNRIETHKVFVEK